jgi:hypothetical protein
LLFSRRTSKKALLEKSPMLNLCEPERSIIRLTQREHEQLESLEREVASGLSEFLRVGRALSTIRNKRLFRETHPTFDQYVVERWGLGIGATGSLITSFHIAEQLVDAGIDLPAQTTQSAMRSLAKLSPLEGLRAAVWRYAVTVAPGASCPPIALLQRISRIIREALDSDAASVDGAGNPVDEAAEEPAKPEESVEQISSHGEISRSEESATEGRPLGNIRRNPAEKPDPDQRFLRAITRLSTYSGFCVPLIASQVTSDQMASYVWRSCERLKLRLDEVEQALLRQFPNAQAQAA